MKRKTFNLGAIILAALSLFSTALVSCESEPSSGDEVVVDGIRYEIDTKNHSATILKMEEYQLGYLELPDSVYYKRKQYAVKHIAKMAFYGADITGIKLPQPLETIGKSAFERAELHSLTIGPNVTLIERDAIFSCLYLDEIVFEDSTLPITLEDFKISESTAYMVQDLYIGRNITDFAILPYGNLTIGKDVTEIGFKRQWNDRINVYSYPTVPPATKIYLYWAHQPINVYVPAGSVQAYKEDEFWGQLNIYPMK